MRTRRLIGVAAAALVLVTGTAATSGTASAATRGAAPAAATRLATHVHPHPRLALLRAATAKYHSIAVAERHGYAKFVDVNGVACIAMPGMGAMGVHYVNGDRVNDPSIKPFKPEALVYAPGPRGRLQLAAVEYIVVKSAWDAHAQVTAAAVRPRVQLHRRAQPVRAAAVLLAARVGLEAQPGRHVPDVEPGRPLPLRRLAPARQRVRVSRPRSACSPGHVRGHGRFRPGRPFCLQWRAARAVFRGRPTSPRRSPIMPPLSPAAQSLWTDANATGWGVDNGRSYIERIRALPDPDERVRLCRMFMDRQHASFRALELVVYETWRDGLAPDERPVAHSDDFGRLVDRGEEFRTSLAEILDGAGSDVDQAELLTVWVADGARWLGQLRSTRDTAIMNALASGLSPRDVARRLRMSKTQIINIRHRYLRDIEAVGAGTDDIVYRARDGIVVYLNDALRRYTGLDPADVIGRPTTELSHPDDYARFAPSGTRRSVAASAASVDRSGCAPRPAAGAGSTSTSGCSGTRTPAGWRSMRAPGRAGRSRLPSTARRLSADAAARLRETAVTPQPAGSVTRGAGDGAALGPTAPSRPMSGAPPIATGVRRRPGHVASWSASHSRPASRNSPRQYAFAASAPSVARLVITSAGACSGGTSRS